MSFASVLNQFTKSRRRRPSASSSSMDTENTSQVASSLDIAARNSMALPIMMRDMNVMKQGILKLVKLAGGTQRDKADRFFLNASDREKAYETQMSSKQSTSPTKVGGEKKDGKGFFGQANSFLNSMIAGGLTNMLIKGGIIATVLYGLGKFFTSAEFRNGIFDMIGNFGRTVFGEEGWKDVKKNILLGSVILLTGIVAIKTSLALVVAGLAFLAKKLFGFGGVPMGPGGPTNKGGGVLSKTAKGLGYAALGYSLYNMYQSVVGDGNGSSGLGGAAAAGLVGGSLLSGSLSKKSAPVPTNVTEPTKTATPQATNETARRSQTRNSKIPLPSDEIEKGKKLERMVNFFKNLSPKARALLLKKTWTRFGVAIFTRLGSFLLSMIASPFSGGLSLVLALASWGSLALVIYQIYDFWFGEEEEAKKTKEQLDAASNSNALQEVDNFIDRLMSDTSGIGGITMGTNTPDYSKMSNVNPSSPSRSSVGTSAGTAGGGVTFNQLSREQQDALLAQQRQSEGFKPGSLTYELNNPGAIQYSERAKQFGGVRDTTGRGDAAHKGTFAKFPTLQDGINAQRDLWSRVYGDMPIEQALKKWAPYAPSSYSSNIISAATSGKITPSVSPATPSSGAVMNKSSNAMLNSRNAPAAPFTNIDASTKVSNNGGGNGGTISLPASGVTDNNFAKQLIERAIG